MNKVLVKQLRWLEKREEKFIVKNGEKQSVKGLAQFTEKVENKIPKGLKETLDMAFYKGFSLVFEKGTNLIEKTFDQEKISLEYNINNYAVEQKITKKAIRKLDKRAKNSKLAHSCISTIEGAGFGILGIGMPDIPIFLSILLKGFYETALSYGFTYKEESEKIWILFIIRAALCEDENMWDYDDAVEKMACELRQGLATGYNLQEEIKKTSAILSDAMLLIKFLQGIPLVGIVGGISNFSIYHKVLNYAGMKYKKRYLQGIQYGELADY